MAKIHTHYDNLKVARMAPQEVIRAAYKALSQKYHPDKNPGDEKAARIMAILNTAYSTLADPQRRKEHDEWIAAEEWEIEWLESTRADDVRERARGELQARPAEQLGVAPVYRATRDPAWWLGLGLCFGLGCVAGLMLATQPKALTLSAVPGVAGEARPELAASARRDYKSEAKAEPDPGPDNWAVGKAYVPESANPKPPEIRALGITQLIIPPKAPDCDTDLQTMVAPNGEPWPAQSGYVDGYPLGNKGEEMQLEVDNSANGSGVFVKVYDLDRHSNVRHLFVLAHDKITVDQLAAGKYEVRYQNLDIGALKGDCPSRKKSVAS